MNGQVENGHGYWLPGAGLSIRRRASLSETVETCVMRLVSGTDNVTCKLNAGAVPPVGGVPSIQSIYNCPRGSAVPSPRTGGAVPPPVQLKDGTCENAATDANPSRVKIRVSTKSSTIELPTLMQPNRLSMHLVYIKKVVGA